MKAKRESSAIADDYRFLELVGVLADDEATEADKEQAAETAVRLAHASGDRLLWALLLSEFERMVQRGEAAPRAFLEGLAGIFRRFCQGTSMNEAFGLKQERPGGVSTMRRRVTAHTNAQLVAHFIEHDQVSLEEALARAVTVRGGKVSESTMKRDYYAFKDEVKRKRSE